MNTLALINLAGFILLLFKYISLKKSYYRLLLGIDGLISSHAILYSKLMSDELNKEFNEILEETINNIKIYRE